MGKDRINSLYQCAEYLCSRAWGALTFPAPFGRDALPEEKYIAELDAKSGSSLKLTILNQYGNIWTMVAGGGASVIYRFVFQHRNPTLSFCTQVFRLVYAVARLSETVAQRVRYRSKGLSFICHIVGRQNPCVLVNLVNPTLCSVGLPWLLGWFPYWCIKVSN